MSARPELDDLLGYSPYLLRQMYREAGECLNILAAAAPCREYDPYASIFDGIEEVELREFQQRITRALQIQEGRF